MNVKLKLYLKRNLFITIIVLIGGYIYITPDGIKTQEYNPSECMFDYEQTRSLYFEKSI